jgi:hypothetical protein
MAPSTFMPTSWRTPDIEEYRAQVRRFVTTEVAPHQQRWAKQQHVDRDLWNKAGALGMLASDVPSEYGGSDEGFVVTPYGLFWKNNDDDPMVAWWEDLDMDDVELDEGTLTIDEEEVQIDSNDRGLARELYRFIEAMTEWAQGE